MKGAARLAIFVWAAGLSLGTVPARAQETPQPASTPAPGTVGPRELQDFSLQGNVTRPADQPAQRPAARPTPQPPSATVAPAAPARERARPAAEAAPRQAPPARRGEAPKVAPISADFDRPLPPAATPPAVSASTPPQPEPSFAPAPQSRFAPSRHVLIWPWLLAAAALAGAMLFLFLRHRGHRAVPAGGPDLFVAPEPAPAPPRPAPAPRAVEPPAGPRGLVSSSLRPWIEVRIHPLRCVLTEQDVTIEFELELLNSGNAPARAIHVAAAMINAGDRQEQELAEFFAAPPGPGERIDVVQPLKNLRFTTQIAVANDHLRALDVGGRQVFVPLLVFNVRYGFGGKEGQTAVTYMVGRDGKGDKLAPFRLDLGPRLFRGLGARLLPTGIRS